MKRRELFRSVGKAGIIGLLGFTEHSRNMMTAFNEPLVNDNKTITKKSKTMKTIGILGGIGPQATMSFESQFHNAAKQVLPPLFNSGYPPMVVYYHRFAPIVINEDLTPVLPMQPDPRLLDAAKNLGSMADFLVITSNGIHNLQKDIEQASGRKVLSMIDITLEEVKKRKWKKVGVIGYRNALVYTNRLKEMGIAFEIISTEQQEKIDATVKKVMESRDDMDDRLLMMEVIGSLKAKNVDGIIPGCTELPLLLTATTQDENILNPSRLLAEAAVKYSLS